MFSVEEIDLLWASRGHLDYAVSGLAMTHCSQWAGSASAAAHEQLADLVVRVSDLYRELDVVGALMEEAAELERAALASACGNA